MNEVIDARWYIDRDIAELKDMKDAEIESLSKELHDWKLAWKDVNSAYRVCDAEFNQLKGHMYVCEKAWESTFGEQRKEIESLAIEWCADWFESAPEVNALRIRDHLIRLAAQKRNMVKV